MRTSTYRSLVLLTLAGHLVLGVACSSESASAPPETTDGQPEMVAAEVSALTSFTSTMSSHPLPRRMAVSARCEKLDRENHDSWRFQMFMLRPACGVKES